MSYSTAAKILDEAGFSDNANIDSDDVAPYQDAATSQINGVLRRVYSLPLSETPKIVELIETKLAAGHLLLEQYGTEAEGTSADGKDKVDWAEEKLKLIEEGAIQLVDSDNEILTRSTKVTMKGFPDSSTEDADDDEGGGDYQVRMNTEF